MEFRDTPEEAAFRAEARSWLEANARRRSGDADVIRRYFSMDSSPEADREHVAKDRAWQRTLYDGGWAEWGVSPSLAHLNQPCA